MFENIAAKIRFAAKLLIVLGMFGSFGLFVVILTEVSFPMGIISLVCGIASTWIISCLVYGFGELVESSRICAQRLSAIQPPEIIQDESRRKLK